MEAVLKNLESTSELLAISETEYVRQWNESTVKRAFQWSDYCEHIFNRFNAEPTIRTAIENKLRHINDLLRKTFLDHRDLTFTDLGRCRDVLMERLLKNPACPPSVINALFGSFQPNDGRGDGQVFLGFSGLRGSVSCKSAGEMLWATDVNLGAKGGLCIKDLVKGSILREHIQKLIPHTDSESLIKRLLDSISQSNSDKDSYSEMIAGALLCCEDRTAPDVTRNVIFTWLESHPKTLLSMCQVLPVLTLTELAQQSEQFRLAYVGILKNWASALMYDVTEGEWIISDDNGVPFSTLTEHFRYLVTSGHQLEAHTLRELHELKEGDGGFEERGLSVWGDILSELSMIQSLASVS
ncbi:hypothetical protein ACEWY4_011151 [Coilia grayii]|uniref:Uncharacterized protein n=1 Tax=Coilia grayii TaxID=363190 RepID=A0ABD1K3Y4_9TELE